MKLTVNGQDIDLDVRPDMPLLWVLRDKLKLTGTKYGCGIAQCGVCTVHIDGEPVRSCVLPVSAVSGKVTTIEGLSGDGELHPVQTAWMEHDVAQCGYCTAGIVCSVTALFRKTKTPSDEQIKDTLNLHLCRCGSHSRILDAVYQIREGAIR